MRLETDVEPTDRFGRTLVYLYKDGTSINERLVRDGFARAKAYKPNVKYKQTFERLEAQAKAESAGLWRTCVGAREDIGKGTGKAARPARTPAESKQQERALALGAVPSTTDPLVDPGDVKNCSDFDTYEQAKEWFDTYFPKFGDVAKLDGNGDGRPCESLLKAPTVTVRKS